MARSGKGVHRPIQDVTSGLQKELAVMCGIRTRKSVLFYASKNEKTTPVRTFKRPRTRDSPSIPLAEEEQPSIHILSLVVKGLMDEVVVLKRTITEMGSRLAALQKQNKQLSFASPP